MRPKTLSAAVVPVLVGSGLAFGDGAFRLDAAVAALVGALAIQIAANFANDASDAARGADPADRLGPPRMVAAGVIPASRMWAATWLTVAVAVAAGIWLLTIAGWPVVLIGLASLLAMLGYVGGPLPYGYRAGGEVAVFLFFGVVATVGSRFVHDGRAPASAWALSIPVGLLAAAILLVNNLRDVGTDERAGKRTLAVVLGRRRSGLVLRAMVVSAFAATALGAVLRITPPWTALALLALLPARRILRGLPEAGDGPGWIALLVATSALHLQTGILLAVGAALG
jgi:1,4-dihydroxy-2-naphthoate octaprenyltransferase